MSLYKIPMETGPQTFTVRLANVVYQMRVIFRNVDEGGWVLDLSDEGGTPILLGAPLVTGLNLLMQYEYLGIGGELYVITNADMFAVPDFDMLGTSSFLYFWVA